MESNAGPQQWYARLTLALAALGGGLEGPPPPGNGAVPVPIRLLSRRRKASGEHVG